METDCIFCKIANKKLPSEIVFENDKLVVFIDINPKAPKHFLIIPKEHIGTVNDLTDDNRDLIANMVLTAKEVARQRGIENSYKLVFNVGKQGGQVIFHLHLHLLGGWRQETHEVHI